MPTAMARIDARIPKEVKDKIKHAACLREQTVTDFLTDVLDEAASQIIVEETRITLHRDDQRQLAREILSDRPFPPVESMTRLRRYVTDYDNAVVQK